MARPKNSDSNVVIDRVVACAHKIVMDEGETAVTLRRVAKDANVALGTVTYYFPNRRSLLEACMDGPYDWLRGIFEACVAEIIGGKPVNEVNEMFIRRLYRETIKYVGLIRLRMHSSMQLGQLPERRLKKELLPALDAVEMTLGRLTNPLHARLATHSIELLVTRYGVHTDEERMAITKIDTAEAASTAVENHLVDLFRNIFNPDGATPPENIERMTLT